MSWPTRSTSSSEPLFSVLVALGSNLGDRRYNIARAVHALAGVMRVVRVSTIRETAPVDAPAGSPDFLNAVVAGWSSLPPLDLVRGLLAIERRLGRVRRGARNAPRVVDLDLLVHSSHRMAGPELTLPHPRAAGRPFVMEPLRELGLGRMLG